MKPYVCDIYARPVGDFPPRRLTTMLVTADGPDVAAIRAMDEHNALRHNYPANSLRSVPAHSVEIGACR